QSEVLVRITAKKKRNQTNERFMRQSRTAACAFSGCGVSECLSEGTRNPKREDFEKDFKSVQKSRQADCEDYQIRKKKTRRARKRIMEKISVHTQTAPSV
ncbi:hypothetical protein, partial [uncultured Allobaculum sp.]|uniref:hypothetical protein n=1 Tax=uncultured Allobaculum sp. TaxID=1187017 RepID=UPI00263B50EE